MELIVVQRCSTGNGNDNAPYQTEYIHNTITLRYLLHGAAVAAAACAAAAAGAACLLYLYKQILLVGLLHFIVRHYNREVACYKVMNIK